MRTDAECAVEVMRNGGIILYPTDTVWGIGCDATNESAVRRIYALKQRADSKAMIVLLGSEALLPAYTSSSVAADLPDEVSDGRPVTVIYPGAKNMAASLIAADGSIGIRITREPFSQKLCERFGRPVVSTSANISGQPTPRLFSEISEEIKQGVDYVCRYRQDDLTLHRPSAIIRLNADGTYTFIRL